MPIKTGSAFQTQTHAPIQIAQTNMGTSTDQPVQTSQTHSDIPTPGDMQSAGLSLTSSLWICILMVVLALLARRNMKKVPGTFQNCAEACAEGLNQFIASSAGPNGVKYTPLLGTLFVYILFANLIGIIPGFHSPTANLSITLALGLVVFVYVQYEGIREQGVIGHFKHFMGPIIWMAPFIGVLEIISEFVKPFSLGMRLFGNIFGEDVVVIVLAGLATSLGATAIGWIPIQFPMLLLMLLTDVIQALVFTLLACVYISLVTQKHDEESAENAH